MTPEDQFACITYHAIGTTPSQYVIREDHLRMHLNLLITEGYTVEGFRELETRIRSGEGFPHRYVVFSIDDGHESLVVAADLLQEYGCQATFFLTRDLCHRRTGFVSNSEIRQLWSKGFSLGTHGASHRPLTLLPTEECVAELAGSKEWLEDVVGEEIRYMSAPGGFINSRVLRLIREEGYVLTGTCKEWMNSTKSVPLPNVVNRVNIRRHFGITTFKSIVEGHKTFYVRRRARAAILAIPKQLVCHWSDRGIAIHKTSHLPING